ncbi:MAG TPA: hypothetical protein VFB08_13940 [Burkholderiales bacterium]|nr:hypothetical protein [Burkholderiales bacterium]
MEIPSRRKRPGGRGVSRYFDEEGRILLQYRRQDGVKIPWAEPSQMPKPDGSLPVPDHRERQRTRIVAKSGHEFQTAGVRDQQGIRDFELCSILPHFGCTIDADAYNFNPVRAILLPRRHQEGNLLPARLAPSCPEVAHKCRHPPIRQAGDAPVQVRVCRHREGLIAATPLQDDGRHQGAEGGGREADATQDQCITPSRHP